MTSENHIALQLPASVSAELQLDATDSTAIITRDEKLSNQKESLKLLRCLR